MAPEEKRRKRTSPFTIHARYGPGNGSIQVREHRALQLNAYNITFVFEDGRTAAVRALQNETVYSAALRANVRLQSDCLEGACATCKAHCVRGEFSLEDYSDEALSDEEGRERYVLMCRMKATSDCVLELPYEASLALAEHAPARFTGRVERVAGVSSSVYRMDVAPDGGPRVAFLPGQYVHLQVPGTSLARAYSFANAPEAAGPYTFYVKALPRGVMSEYVAMRPRSGDPIGMVGPYGQFYLRPVKRPLLMVAGGTGLAPMLAMLEHLAHTGGCAQPIGLLYGVNEADERFALEQLHAYRDAGLPLAIECAAVAGGAGCTPGHVTSLLHEDRIHGGDCDVYLCGPPPMIDAANRWLHARGVDAKRVHAERFLPS